MERLLLPFDAAPRAALRLKRQAAAIIQAINSLGLSLGRLADRPKTGTTRNRSSLMAITT
jgi:hypothetical protein